MPYVKVINCYSARLLLLVGCVKYIIAISRAYTLSEPDTIGYHHEHTIRHQHPPSLNARRAKQLSWYNARKYLNRILKKHRSPRLYRGGTCNGSSHLELTQYPQV